MKISENNYPALKHLNGFNNVSIDPNWQSIMPIISKNIKKSNFHTSDIFKISEPFNQAYLKAYLKMTSDSLFGSQYYKRGVILDFKIPLIDNKFSIFYDIKDFSKGDYSDSTYYLFQNNHLVASRINDEKYITKDNKSGSILLVTQEILDVFEKLYYNFNKSKISQNELMMEIGMYTFTSLIGYLNFIDYADIETKELMPRSKEGKTIKCKYINNTDYKITYLNSTWFTNLVKSDAFKVSGHFRLQPCHDSNGLPTKKLIWINDFVKSGYTAPARKNNKL